MKWNYDDEFIVFKVKYLTVYTSERRDNLFICKLILILLLADKGLPDVQRWLS